MCGLGLFQTAAGRCCPEAARGCHAQMQISLMPCGLGRALPGEKQASCSSREHHNDQYKGRQDGQAELLK